jgi:hypothetical protein
MNRLEQQYANHLELRRIAGDILWWSYEAIKFRLAKATYYTPDFVVMMPDGELQCHEVKGFWRDDARVKIKVVAEVFPITFVAVTGSGKRGWKTKLI